MQLSYWEEDSFWSGIDALVIGAGLVGLQAAIHLKQQRPRWRVLVVEQLVGVRGASTRNAGFACFGSMTELLADLATHEADLVWNLVDMRWRGLYHLRTQLGASDIAYEGLGGYEVFTAADEDAYAQCMDQREQVNQILRDIVGMEEVFCPADEEIAALGLSNTQHMIVNRAEGQLHPGRLLRRLLTLCQVLGVELWQGLSVQSFDAVKDGICLTTDQGQEIFAHRVLVATNGFAKRLLPELPVQPARNQVLLTAPIPDLKLRGAFHYDRGYVYFRDVGDRLLIGGARNLSPHEEQTDQFGQTALIQTRLLDILHQVILPHREVEITHRWSGILGVGPEKLPLVEAHLPNLVLAIRLGGMGVAIGGEIGRQGAELLLQEAG